MLLNLVMFFCYNHPKIVIPFYVCFWLLIKGILLRDLSSYSCTSVSSYRSFLQEFPAVFFRTAVLVLLKMLLFWLRLNHLYTLYAHPFHTPKDFVFPQTTPPGQQQCPALLEDDRRRRTIIKLLHHLTWCFLGLPWRTVGI